MGYTIQKVYNNNIVLTTTGTETAVLVSKGIGFGKKTGDIIEYSDTIEKIFYEKDSKKPEPVISHNEQPIKELTKGFIQVAETKIGKLNENLEKVLVDHIQFALQRLEMGLTIENPFIEEIISLYPVEFELAGVATKALKEHFNIDIGEEERGFIALHLYSARDNHSLSETIKITNLYKDCIKLIEKNLEKKISFRLRHNKAFLKNLQILTDQVAMNTTIIMPLKRQVIKQMKEVYLLADQIGKKIETVKGIHFSEDVTAYLAIEIQKLIAFNN